MYSTMDQVSEGDCRSYSQMSFSKMLSLSLILVFPLMICGMSTSFPAVALPQMDLMMSHASYFGSVLQFTSPFGAIMVGFIIDRYGRRSALLFSIIPSILGWFILYLNLNTWTSIAGQMLNGLMVGAVGYPAQVYAGECIMINNVSLRNSFLSWIAISNAFGMFLVYVLGYFVSYRSIAIIASSLAAFSFALTYFCIPESPSWLHLKGRTGDAEWSQKQLGLCNPLLENVHPHHSSVACEDLELSPFHALSLQKLKRKDVWKPLLLGSVLSALLSLSGGMPVLTYMVQVIGPLPNVTSSQASLWTPEEMWIDINTIGNNSIGNNSIGNNFIGNNSISNNSIGNNFIGNNSIGNNSIGNNSTGNNSTGNASISWASENWKFASGNSVIDELNDLSASNRTEFSNSSYGLSIVSGAIILFANILMSLLLPYFGVKKILIYPLLGMAVGMLVEGLTSDFKSDPETFRIHVAAIWLITFCYSFSLLIVPDTMLGDLFPVDAKGYASIPYLFEGFFTAVICKAHPFMRYYFGGILYFYYSGICVISAAFVLFFIPEIVGKTLKQINEGFL